MNIRRPFLLGFATTWLWTDVNAATYTWTGEAQGAPSNWFNVTNWSPRGVPGGGDTIFIGGVVDIPDWTFTDLNVTGGETRGDFTVGGTLRWSGGQLTGTITVSTNSVLRYCRPAASTSAAALAGVLLNHGLFEWSAGSYTALLLNGARFLNMPGGEVDLQGNDDIYAGGGVCEFINQGTLRKSGGGTGTASFKAGVAFNNQGLVKVETGTLGFPDGFTCSGQFWVATNATVQLTGGTFHLLPGHTFAGPGNYGVFYGSVVIDGPITDPGFLLSSGTLTLDDQISGTLLWSDGVLSGTPRIASGGVVRYCHSAASFWAATLSGVLTNYGLFEWSAGSYTTLLLNGARIQNMPGGVLDLQGNDDFYAGGGVCEIINQGTLRKSGGGTGTASFKAGVAFNNQGLVEVETGVLKFTDGFTCSGQFWVATNATVQLTGGTFHLLPGHSFAGPGNYGVFGSVVIDGPITDPGFLFSSGTLTLNDQISGTLLWSDGVLSGTPRIASGGVVRYCHSAASSWPATLTGVLTNHGLFEWSAGSHTTLLLNGARIQNMPGGVVDLQGNDDFYAGGGVCEINNQGTLRKSGGGTGTASVKAGVAFNNQGLVEVRSGTLQLPGNGLLPGSRLLCVLGSTSDYGRIVFTSAAQLTGTLGANLAAGFTPPTGTQFQVVSSPGLSGGFTGLDLPARVFAIQSATGVLLVVGSGSPGRILNPAIAGTNFTFLFQSEAGVTCGVETSDDLGTTWSLVETIPGDGSMKSVATPRADALRRFFRLKSGN